MAPSQVLTQPGRLAESRAAPWLLLITATIPASFALLRDGFFSSSDGMIHLYRVFELDRALRAGVLYPRWFPQSGYGYGLPVLNYYPPLAYYLAEFFHLLGAGYIGSLKLFIAVGFILAACSMFLFARDLLGAAPALIAAIAFTYLPYLVSDAYIRGNLPEFLAMSLIPLLLYSFRQGMVTRGAKFFMLAALVFAAIVLTHHLTAMLAAPLLAAYVIFLCVFERRWRGLLACVGAATLGLVLGAFYWVPALAELDLVFVGPASLARFLVSRLVSAQSFFAPSLAYVYLPQSEALQHAAGFPQTILALIGGVVLVSLRGAKRRSSTCTAPPLGPEPRHRPPGQVDRGVEGNAVRCKGPSMHDDEIASSRKAVLAVTYWHLLFFLILLIISIFMMLNLSTPLWYAIPSLRFMQFPWRMQVLAGPSIAFLIGVLAKEIGRIADARFRVVFYGLVSLVLVLLALVNLPDRSFALTDSQVDFLHSSDPDYVVAQMGWSWTREFVPATVQEENVVGAMTRGPQPETPRAIPSVRMENDGLYSRTLRVSAAEPTEISLHQFFFPGWQGYVDGAPARTYPNGSLGLATVDAPAGDHRIEFRFEETPLRMAMDVISVLAWTGIGAWLLVARRRAFLTLVIAITLLSSIFWFRTRAASAARPTALSADLGHDALLIGYSTERAGDTMHVTLDWFALRELARDYMVTVQILSADGKLIAQNDSLTDWGVTPTTRWQRGELVSDRHALSLADLPRGTYRLVVGMYLPRENGFENAAVYDRTGNVIGNQVELGPVEIGP